jgi:hypothetical protein
VPTAATGYPSAAKGGERSGESQLRASQAQARRVMLEGCRKWQEEDQKRTAAAVWPALAGGQ